MRMQLTRSHVLMVLIILVFFSCSKDRTFNGNWGALDSNGNYSELYFSDSTIDIYEERGGLIPQQRFTTKDDSLFTNVFKYKFHFVNQDSLILEDTGFKLYMKRIHGEFTLDNYAARIQDQDYIDSFYERMYQCKGRRRNAPSKTYPKIDDETIDIFTTDGK